MIGIIDQGKFLISNFCGKIVHLLINLHTFTYPLLHLIGIIPCFVCFLELFQPLPWFQPPPMSTVLTQDLPTVSFHHAVIAASLVSESAEVPHVLLNHLILCQMFSFIQKFNETHYHIHPSSS